MTSSRKRALRRAAQFICVLLNFAERLFSARRVRHESRSGEGLLRQGSEELKGPEDFGLLRDSLSLIVIRDELTGYLVDIVRATRQHESVLVGAGPRATQSLIMASRANAAISGRDFVTPDDVKAMALPVLEHRLILRPEFEIEGLTVAEVIEQILHQIAVPR